MPPIRLISIAKVISLSEWTFIYNTDLFCILSENSKTMIIKLAFWDRQDNMYADTNRFQSPLIRELWSEKPYNSALLFHLATLSKGKLNGVPKKIMYRTVWSGCHGYRDYFNNSSISTQFCDRRLWIREHIYLRCHAKHKCLNVFAD